MSHSEISSNHSLTSGIRCPTECQLTHSDAPWTCRVSLRLTKVADGSTQEVPFGETITKKTDVTERIRRAQRAILSPSLPLNAFLSGSESDFGHTEKCFSSDCIVLHISGPEITDINFIDLAGSFSLQLLDVFSLVPNTPNRSLFRG